MPSTLLTRPDFSHIRPLLLEMSRERSSEGLFQLVAERLAAASNIGLARVWRKGRGDRCSSCSHALLCKDREECLHLSAQAAGTQQVARATDTLHALSTRLPLRHSLPSESPAGAQPVLMAVDAAISDGVPLEWARDLGLAGVCCSPLLHHGELLGAIEVFTTREVPEEGPDWLRVIADHAAIAISNSLAFEEIERLRAALSKENQELRREVSAARVGTRIIGDSDALRAVLEDVAFVAPTEASVLIQGESGTGKELIATELHRASLRVDGPLVRVNCASIPAELYESEFFGHRKGAFTGAVDDRVGRFELADGGTLFLDEVGELPLDIQAKLLRVLQEGQYERVGESESRTTDVRIIAATNRDLATEASEGRFREDLYYRLNVFPIQMPPLRERSGDLVLLAGHLIEEIASKLRRRAPLLSQAALDEVLAHDWPGNVRELRNALERAVIVTRGDTLERVPIKARVGRREASPAVRATAPTSTTERIWTKGELQAFERANEDRAVEAAGGRISGKNGAAARLGVPAATLASRLRRRAPTGPS